MHNYFVRSERFNIFHEFKYEHSKISLKSWPDGKKISQSNFLQTKVEVIVSLII